jgi:hypothetical protein
MSEYKIYKIYGQWMVYSGHVSYGDWVKDDIVFYGDSITECYSWIKAKQEGLMG